VIFLLFESVYDAAVSPALRRCHGHCKPLLLNIALNASSLPHCHCAL